LIEEEKVKDGTVYFHYAWTHDALGLEKEAIPYYEKAIELGLELEEMQRALLGLGSSYRCIGEYEKAAATLEKGAKKFPGNRAFSVFLAMAYYNLGKHSEAIRLLLETIAETSADPYVDRYRKAISFYANHLDEVW
jgi:tetratricopeptide (TPR) repeat protein